MSTWKNLLSSVPPTGRDNVVSMEPRDPHKPPAAWTARYREASEALAYKEKLERELAEFDTSTEAAVTAAKLERVQRVAALNNAKSRHEDIINDIILMAGNVGIVSKEAP